MRASESAITRRRLLRMAAQGATSLGALGLVGACGSGGGDGAGFAGQLAVTQLDAGTTALVPLVARELGYFAGNGLDLELVGFPGGTDSVRGVLSTSGFGETSTIGGVAAFGKGARELRLVAGGYHTAPIVYLVRADSGIETIQDLRGRKIASSRPGANSTYHINKILEAEGLVPGRDAEIVFVGSPPDAWTATQQGITDVAWSASPLSTQLVASGAARTLVRAGDYTRNWMSVSRWATESFLQERPEVVRGWLRAEQQATDTIRSDPATAARVLAGVLNIDESLAGRALDEAGDVYGLQIDRAAVEEAVRAAVSLDFLESADMVDIDSLISTEFLPAAA